LLANPDFNLFGIYDQRKTIGLLSVWNLHEFSFIEHLAIQDTERGKGFGTQAVQQVLTRFLAPVVLEVEQPISVAAQKRIAFYKRHGFSVCEGGYYQPPYSTCKNKVKMLLMSFPEKIMEVSFNQVKARIYDSVYNLSE